MRKLNYPITFLMIAICVVVYVLSLMYPLIQNGGLVPSLVDAGQKYRLITYAFLHGSVFHLLGNMYALASFGPSLENGLSKPMYLFFVVFTAVASSGFCCLFGDPNVTTVGLSGVLYGMFALHIVVFIKSGLIRNKMILVPLMHMLAINVIISLMPGVSFLGHAGGFVAGLIFGFLFI